nr:hypothetical protein KRP22_11496 [Phytophthora ramorum]
MLHVERLLHILLQRHVANSWRCFLQRLATDAIRAATGAIRKDQRHQHRNRVRRGRDPVDPHVPRRNAARRRVEARKQHEDTTEKSTKSGRHGHTGQREHHELAEVHEQQRVHRDHQPVVEERDVTREADARVEDNREQ